VQEDDRSRPGLSLSLRWYSTAVRPTSTRPVVSA
jgi:hypothetical protein